MKGPFLSTVFLTLSLAATAQVQGDSPQRKIDGALDKIDLDSLGNQLTQLPDSLLPAYHRIDSIRISFNQKADSLQSEYRNALSRIDAHANKINGRIDSLSHLNINTSRYTRTLDSLNNLRQKIEQKFTSRLNDLKAKITGKLNDLDIPD